MIRNKFTQAEKDLLASGNFTARWRHGSHWKLATVKDPEVRSSSLTYTEYVNAVNAAKTTRTVREGVPVRLYPGEAQFFQTWKLGRDDLVEWAKKHLYDTDRNVPGQAEAELWADDLLSSPGAFALTNGARHYLWVWDNGKGADIESQVPVS